jgi:glyoxylase-like metal-dependent hydrolase (beta-lactamase superfamily II)
MNIDLEASGPIRSGAHRIASIQGGRPLFQFFLEGERSVLIDTGELATASETISPYLRSIGKNEPDLVVLTHSDTDHHGGAGVIQSHSARTVVGCGLHDRELIENPDLLLLSRYQAYHAEHGIGYTPDELSQARDAVSAPRVDIVWTGGEVFSIEPGWDIEIIATPGHSAGHIAVYDRRDRALYAGDAIHGSFYPDVNGKPMLPPNYVDLDAYLQTIATLRARPITSLHGAHWPARRGPQVQALFDESEVFVEHLDAAVRTTLSAGDGATLLTIIRGVQEILPMWREAPPINLAYSVEAHLSRLVNQREAKSWACNGSRTYSFI